MYRYTCIQNRSHRAAKLKLKKWCVYVCGKGGGGVELHRVGNLI